ncbi:MULTISPECIES: sensor histidine kinase [Rhodobacterales]|uniref:sensor histidine kinase n=1 Tax=Rhodobacterales TaxID=204455 RepID=UPI00237F0C57|nr:HAMP domain-containing sensor histidine kinase [Phaeobacter gallaeciensis]MDE4193407.1 HAMP domain-containing sensor histidine kinase [Phaeobacter gallaeciensis]MDE4201669.1 HAMP domain-containing sensor histidine kinase [Phaeobacter gallaeciensis]MDE4205853.1 HAMP domain-containing sensor histidine kinase [Phaeobacter gallaeciensis]MDE4209932.1 HAMP domain-containing sensor histidine kinase [Phaeobacter gallaeciensis]MDE4218360.1 HAMP domain-containing sensor histidine kinase [Phaeobacter 
MLNTLSGRFLVLTTVFVMLAEVLIFVPSISRFRLDYLSDRLERAQLASLALLADDMLDSELEKELLANAGVFNVVLRRDEMRQLVLSSPIPQPIEGTFDLRMAGPFTLISDAMTRMVTPGNRIIRVIGAPVRDAGLLIEITMETAPLRSAMIDYGVRILILSAVISVFTALLLFMAVRVFLVRPIKGVVGYMQRYAAAPEDARGIIQPNAGVTELREAEEALMKLQTELTHALKQKERLAQLGGAVAKVSHDLRNILTSAQLFTDRIETSEDPLVRRLAPKLVNSITRAVSLCEGTLAFGRAEEPAPTFAFVSLHEIACDIAESETLAASGGEVEIVAAVPAGLTVRADQEQLYRIVMNLVRNARQAIAATGKPGQVKITASEEDDAWTIRITDTGPGLPKKAQDNLFTPFQGGARKGGSGLGLAIAQELARGHGGAVYMRQTGPEGTVFEICLPKGDGAF